MDFERRKLYDFLGTHLVKLFKETSAVIAGGSITSLFCNRDIADIDVYVRSEEALVEIISSLYEDRCYIVSHTGKATLFKCDGEKLIQVIHIKCFNSVQEIFDSFDFTACMGAYDFTKETFVFNENFLKHNSQRILEFNPRTSFPLMSLLRVQKYEQKGYKISKPEFLKIMLTCMSQEINSYAELKEQLGGLYGLNLDKLFDDTKEFSLASAVEQLSNLYLHEDYFRQPVEVQFESLDDLLDSISKAPRKYFELNDKIYLVRANGIVKMVDSIPRNSIRIRPQCFLGNKLYKYVEKRGSRYWSFWSNAFEYRLGETVVANNGCGLFCGLLKDTEDFSYRYHKGAVLIELEIEDYSDIIAINNSIQVKKLKFIREVPDATTV